jgi:hypothetical protein
LARTAPRRGSPALKEALPTQAQDAVLDLVAAVSCRRSFEHRKAVCPPAFQPSPKILSARYQPWPERAALGKSDAGRNADQTARGALNKGALNLFEQRRLLYGSCLAAAAANVTNTRSRGHRALHYVKRYRAGSGRLSRRSTAPRAFGDAVALGDLGGWEDESLRSICRPLSYQWLRPHVRERPLCAL